MGKGCLLTRISAFDEDLPQFAMFHISNERGPLVPSRWQAQVLQLCPPEVFQPQAVQDVWKQPQTKATCSYILSFLPVCNFDWMTVPREINSASVRNGKPQNRA